MQLVTVHGLHNGFVIPLVFCLATGKTIGHYRQIIQHLKNEVRRRSHARLHPRRVVCDFEQSLLIAIQTELPTTRVSGCFFHFTQRLWRRLQELGLAAHYRRDRRLKRFVRKVMAIAFLPVLLVRQNFRMIRISRLVGRLCRQFPRLDDWLRYVEATYVEANSTFPPPIWNVFDRNARTRTNNQIEGNFKVYGGRD